MSVVFGKNVLKKYFFKVMVVSNPGGINIVFIISIVKKTKMASVVSLTETQS